jgi:phenylpyruvate tautomerase PptA (4-oxalocrotonate tautomerase family)
MPVLRLYGPHFSFEQKKIMAAELTAALVQALSLPKNAQKQIVIHFIPCELDNMAVDGRLLSEIEESRYQVEYHDATLSQEQKKHLTQRLLPLLHELLGIRASSDDSRIMFLFQEHSAQHADREKRQQSASGSTNPVGTGIKV